MPKISVTFHKKQHKIATKCTKMIIEEDEELTRKDCLQPLLSSFTYSGCLSMAVPKNCKM